MTIDYKPKNDPSYPWFVMDEDGVVIGKFIEEEDAIIFSRSKVKSTQALRYDL